MKTKSIILAVAVACAAILSQEAKAQFRVGLGYSLGADKMKFDNTINKTKLHGFNIAASYNFNLLEDSWGNLGIEPGIMYNFVSEGTKDTEAGITVKESTNEHYLDIPVNVKYGYDIVPEIFGAYVFAGPVFSFGVASQTNFSISGKAGNNSFKGEAVIHNYSGKVTSSDLSGPFLDEINKQAQGTEYGWFDFKIGIGLGLKIVESIDIRLGYNFGLVNRYTGDTKGLKHKTDLLYVGLGYNF